MRPVTKEAIFVLVAAAVVAIGARVFGISGRLNPTPPPVNCCYDDGFRPLSCDYDERGGIIENYNAVYKNVCHFGEKQRQ
jgi:hypothetical protein